MSARSLMTAEPLIVRVLPPEPLIEARVSMFDDVVHMPSPSSPPSRDRFFVPFPGSKLTASRRSLHPPATKGRFVGLSHKRACAVEYPVSHYPAVGPCNSSWEANLISPAPNSSLLSGLYDWLAASQPLEQSDVIFVLAGRECRKHFALEMLREGWAPKLLLSVGRFEIRRFSRLELPRSLDLLAIASATVPRHRHYFVTIDSEATQVQRIAVGRLGTLSEILAFSDWLREHNLIRSATVVSSGFHLKRVRMCCRRLVPEGTRLTFVAVPDESRYLRGHWWRDPNEPKLVFFELLKIAIYQLLGQRLMRRARPVPAFAEV